MIVPEPSDRAFVALVRRELADAEQRAREILAEPPEPAPIVKVKRAPPWMRHRAERLGTALPAGYV